MVILWTCNNEIIKHINLRWLNLTEITYLLYIEIQKNLYFWKHGFPKHGRFILNGHTVPKTINVYTRNSTMYIKT